MLLLLLKDPLELYVTSRVFLPGSESLSLRDMTSVVESYIETNPLPPPLCHERQQSVSADCRYFTHCFLETKKFAQGESYIKPEICIA